MGIAGGAMMRSADIRPGSTTSAGADKINFEGDRCPVRANEGPPTEPLLGKGVLNSRPDHLCAYCLSGLEDALCHRLGSSPHYGDQH